MTTPELVAKLRIVDPELAASVDIVPSAALPAGRVVAVDPKALIVALDPAPELTTSSEASLHMSDAAAELVTAAGAVADPVRSMFQSGSVALKIVMGLSFVRTRTTACAYVDGAVWA